MTDHFVITKKQWLDLNDLAQSQAATVAELRAEVERLKHAYDHALGEWQQASKKLAEISADFRLARTMQEETRVKWLDEAKRAEAAESALATATAEVERFQIEAAGRGIALKDALETNATATARIEKLETALRKIAMTRERVDQGMGHFYDRPLSGEFCLAIAMEALGMLLDPTPETLARLAALQELADAAEQRCAGVVISLRKNGSHHGAAIASSAEHEAKQLAAAIRALKPKES